MNLLCLGAGQLDGIEQLCWSFYQTIPVLYTPLLWSLLCSYVPSDLVVS